MFFFGAVSTMISSLRYWHVLDIAIINNSRMHSYLWYFEAGKEKSTSHATDPINHGENIFSLNYEHISLCAWVKLSFIKPLNQLISTFDTI